MAVENRLTRLLASQKDLLSIYYTAGYPLPEDTLPILQRLEKAGCNLVELGLPFSDPLADGPTIQASSTVSLNNGMTTHKLFTQIADMRKTVDMPVLLMGYLNPVIQYGFEAFIKKCAEVGVDGLILPDLPLDIYKEEYQEIVEAYNLSMVFLITPQTSPERIKQVDALTSGFVYMVSDSATTGKNKGISEEQLAYFKRIAESNMVNKTIIGFGINTKDDFAQACKFSSGAIVGSGFIRHLNEHGIDEHKMTEYIRSFR